MNLVIAGTLTAHHGRNDADSVAGNHFVTYQKTTRPATSDHADVWERREVAATLSPFDLGSESRACELVLSATGPVTHALTAEGHDASEDGTGRGTPIVAFDPGAGGDHTSSGAFYEDGTTPTVQGRRAPAVALDMQNYALGDLAPTLDAAGPRSHRGAGLLTDTTVRRLTPRECERLQGFPDNWTATSFGKPQADSPRYQEMGNAVAVPVFEWVARGIARVA